MTSKNGCCHRGAGFLPLPVCGFGGAVRAWTQCFLSPSSSVVLAAPFASAPGGGGGKRTASKYELCGRSLSLSLCPPPRSPLRWWNNGFRGQVGERRELLRRVFLCNVCSPPGDERGDAIDGQWNKWTFCVHLRRPKKRNTEILEPGREKTN